MKKEYFFFLLMCIVLLFPQQGSALGLGFPRTPAALAQPLQGPSAESLKKSTITYSLTPGVHNTWGYTVYVDNKATIVQPTPPGMSGNEGFKTKAGAESVAKLVVQKMKKGEMPPSVTIEEMKKLKAI